MQDNDETIKDLLLLELLIQKYVQIVDAAYGGYILVKDPGLNYYYTVISESIKSLMENPSLKTLKSGLPLLYEDILGEASYIDISWDEMEINLQSFLAKVQKQLVLEGADKEAIEIALSSDIQDTFKAIDEYTKQVRLIRYEEETENGLRAKSEADRLKQEIFGSRSEGVPALLSFTNISRPVISIGNKQYHLKPMRRDGKAFEIIEYCYMNALGSTVTIDQLKVELPKKNIGMHGVSNLKKVMQNSSFDPNKGPLAPFIEITASTLRLNASVVLSRNQIDAIASNAQK